MRYDACSADIYVQSIYTIPVGAYSQNGAPADYDEKCASKLTVAYVDNTRNSRLGVVSIYGIFTTSYHNNRLHLHSMTNVHFNLVVQVHPLPMYQLSLH